MSKAMKYLKQIDKKRSASSATLSPLGRVAPPTKPVYVAPVPTPTIDWAETHDDPWAETRADPAQALRDAFQTMKDYDFRKDRDFVIVPEKCLSLYKKDVRVNWADTRSTDPAQDLRAAWEMIKVHNVVASFEKFQKCLEVLQRKLPPVL